MQVQCNGDDDDDDNDYSCDNADEGDRLLLSFSWERHPTFGAPEVEVTVMSSVSPPALFLPWQNHQRICQSFRSRTKGLGGSS